MNINMNKSLNPEDSRGLSSLSVLWKLLFVFMLCVASTTSFAKADNHCRPIFGSVFNDLQDGKNFAILRADFNCNGVVDTIFAKQDNSTTEKFDLYAYSDINENGKTDLKIRFMPKFLILYVDVNEDGIDDYVGYDYDYDLKIDAYL